MNNNNNNDTIMIRDDNDKDDENKHSKRVAFYYLCVFILIGIGCLAAIYYSIILFITANFLTNYFPISVFLIIILFLGGGTLGIVALSSAHETFVGILEMK